MSKKKRQITLPLDDRPIENDFMTQLQNEVARSTAPLMEVHPYKGEEMNASEPDAVTVHTDPTEPNETTVTARFNRKKVAKIAGTATAAVAFLAIFGAAMKNRGKEEFIDDVARANGDDTDEPTAS